MAAADPYKSAVQLRRLLLKNHRLAALLMAFALAMKLLTPTGYMFVHEGSRIAVILCSGTALAAARPEMPAMSGMDHSGGHGPSRAHDKPELPCAFAGLLAPALGAVDAILLAAAIAFIAMLALRPFRPIPARRALYLRPPLRGPPITR